MNAETVGQIRAAAEFMELSFRFKGIQGWLKDLEGYTLYRLARDGEGAGAIVEIGSWMGRSTAWLAAGSMARNRELVYAVDTFDGGPALKAEDYPVLKEKGTTYHAFEDNLERLGLLDHVEPIVSDSRAAAAKWDRGGVRLLFIDGDHSYEAVKADLEAWLPHIVPSGYIAFDDVHDHYPGVQRLTAEATADNGPLKRILSIGKIWVTRRRAP
jgi:predicted O-methyltransferase YrrM